MHLSHEERARQLRKPQGSGAEYIMEYMNKGNAVLYSHMLHMMEIQDNSTILELGQGNAFMLPNIFEGGKNIKYCGIDYSEDSVRLAKDLHRELLETKDIVFELGMIENMPFKSESFNLVFGTNIIYFWDTPAAALKEIYRVMESDSKLVLGYRPKKYMGAMPFVSSGFTLYNPEELEDLLFKNGFRNITFREFEETPREIEGKSYPMSHMITVAQK